MSCEVPRSDHHRALPVALAELAELEFRLGDWAAAHACALDSLRVAEAAGSSAEAMLSFVRLAGIEAGLGHSHACREHAARAIELSRREQSKAAEAMAGQALGFLELGLGRIDLAVEWLERVAAICLDHPRACAAATTWAYDLTEAYIRCGDQAGAERSVAALAQLASRTRSWAVVAGLERSRAMVAGEDTFERLFEGAVAWTAHTRQPFEQARTQLCFGERLLRARRPVEARVRIHAALDTFEALGAQPWARRASAELARPARPARRRSAWSVPGAAWPRRSGPPARSGRPPAPTSPPC